MKKVVRIFNQQKLHISSMSIKIKMKKIKMVNPKI
jgi:hypothetical protein